MSLTGVERGTSSLRTMKFTLFLMTSRAKPRKLRCLRLHILVALLLAGLGLGVWLERETLLRSSADLWIVADPVTGGGAVVVLGGGLEIRPFVAADLYHKGL